MMAEKVAEKEANRTSTMAELSESVDRQEYVLCLERAATLRKEAKALEVIVEEKKKEANGLAMTAFGALGITGVLMGDGAKLYCVETTRSSFDKDKLRILLLKYMSADDVAAAFSHATITGAPTKNVTFKQSKSHS